jgi:hypothetical protein
MTQAFCNHFNCRQIAPNTWVLRRDYDYECWGDNSQWWFLAGASALGLLVISFGVPISFAVWMHRDWIEQMRLVRHEGKSQVLAHRDFRHKFSYILVRQQLHLRPRQSLQRCDRACSPIARAATAVCTRTTSKPRRITLNAL